MAMQDMNDQVQARLAKLAKFKEMGIEAYPHKFNRTHDSKMLKENKEALMAKSLLPAAWSVSTARARCASCT